MSLSSSCTCLTGNVTQKQSCKPFVNCSTSWSTGMVTRKKIHLCQAVDSGWLTVLFIRFWHMGSIGPWDWMAWDALNYRSTLRGAGASGQWVKRDWDGKGRGRLCLLSVKVLWKERVRSSEALGEFSEEAPMLTWQDNQSSKTSTNTPISIPGELGTSLAKSGGPCLYR
jgi:hypothetical protein